MKKVSFDYDGTLSNIQVQFFAKDLIEKKYDVWIITGRMQNVELENGIWNSDIYKTIELLNIPRNRVIFTEMQLKYKTIFENNFIFHLDDNKEEIEMINENTKCIGIYYDKKGLWKRKCKKALNN